jgi:hypothetical protein
LKRKYPKYEIIKISIDENFNITNIENGEIKHLNEDFFIVINNRKYFYYDLLAHENIYPIDLNTDDLKNIGEKIYKSIRKFDSYEILENSSGYEVFLDQLFDSILIVFNKNGYIFNNMKIIATSPVAGQYTISKLEILNDNTIKIILEYDWRIKYKIAVYYK